MSGSVVNARAAAGSLEKLLVALVSMLLSWRWLVPTEGAELGLGLWIVQFSLAILVLWAICCWLRGSFDFRFHTIDLAVGAFVAGHLISGALALGGESDVRSTLNMLCEWIGLGATYFLLRQTIRSDEIRRKLVVTTLALFTALAGLGVWQHFFWYQQTAAAYQEIRDELDKVLAQSQSPSNFSQRRRLETELLQFGVPPTSLEGRGRTSYEARLLTSTEPLGRFALANSFAGLLAVALVLLSAVLVDRWRNQSLQIPVHVWITAAVVGSLIAFCLILTKSRTAYVASSIGITVLAISLLTRRARPSGRVVLICVVAISLVAGLFVAAFAMGGLDRFVIAEAPKSLRYRLEYWQGTWDVLQQHPWWGIGPGNFRSHYLQYKLAQSSEEISDPHNLLLDAWVNGGILSLCGLIAIGVLAAIAYSKSSDTNRVDDVQDTPRDRSGQSPSTAGRIVIPLPHPVVMGTAGSLLLGLVLDPGVQMVGLAVMWSAALPLLSSVVGQVSFRPATFCLAAAVLAVHLLGAGGIGMPAICQTLLLLVVLMTPSIAQDASPRGHSQLPLIAVVAAAIGLFVGCWRVGLGPVRSRTEAISEGDYFALQRGDLNKAEVFYRRAAQLDPWSSEPWRKLSVLHMGRWLASTDEAGEDELTAAIASMEKAIEKNPRSWTDFRTLGEYHLRGFSRTRNPEEARAAVAMYRTAVDLYPNDAELRAGLAVAFARAEKPAESRREALRAMELNIITTNAGHIDRVLPEKTLELIQKLAESGRFPDAGTDSD